MTGREICWHLLENLTQPIPVCAGKQLSQVDRWKIREAGEGNLRDALEKFN